MLWLYLALTSALVTGTPVATWPWEPAPDLVAHVESMIPTHAAEEIRLRLLHQTLVSNRGLGIQQADGATGTSREVWRAGEADCVGFAYLFAGLARALGIPTGFAIESLDDTTEPAGPGLRLRQAHVTVSFRDRFGQQWLVDHGGFRRRGGEAHHLGDREAAALLWANRGARALLEGRCEEARRLSAVAADLAPQVDDIQNNLGVVSKLCKQKS